MTSSMITTLSHQEEAVGQRGTRVPKGWNFKHSHYDLAEDRQSGEECRPNGEEVWQVGAVMLKYSCLN